jgi:hypothetical protein
MDAAVANIKQLVAAARSAGPIVHVRHLGTVGGLFDPQGERGEFIPGWSHRATKPSSANCCRARSTAPACKTPAGPGLAGPDRLRFHEPLQRQHHRTRRQEPGLSLHPGGRRLRHPRPAFKGVLSAEHVQQTEMAIMADNFATLALTKDLICR